MLRKGAYRYDYMNSMKKFTETKLPSQDAFYNRINDQPLSDGDFVHAQHVWGTFKCRTMRDYHDIYLKSDVYLFADDFEMSRRNTHSLYGLDVSLISER